MVREEPHISFCIASHPNLPAQTVIDHLVSPPEPDATLGLRIADVQTIVRVDSTNTLPPLDSKARAHR
jgi:hypothetical protein